MSMDIASPVAGTEAARREAARIALAAQREAALRLANATWTEEHGAGNEIVERAIVRQVEEAAAARRQARLQAAASGPAVPQRQEMPTRVQVAAPRPAARPRPRLFDYLWLQALVRHDA